MYIIFTHSAHDQVQDLKSYISNRCSIDLEQVVVVRADRAFNEVSLALLEERQVMTHTRHDASIY